MSLTKLLKPLDNQISGSDDALPKNMYTIQIIVGKRGSGKSTLLLNSLNHKEFYKNYFDRIYLLSPTASRDSKFDELVDELKKDNRYYSKCNEDSLNEIIEDLREFNDNWKKKKRQPRSLLILDDCIHDLPKTTQKSTLHELITTNRHLKCSVIITTQLFNKLNTLIRGNADIISFFTTNNEHEKKTFSEEYGIPIEIINDICVKNNDFIHITYCSGQRLIFDKFDLIK